MKILVDLSYVDKDNPTGVSVFALRLLHAIQKLVKDIDFVFLANKTSCEYIKGGTRSWHVKAAERKKAAKKEKVSKRRK